MKIQVPEESRGVGQGFVLELALYKVVRLNHTERLAGCKKINIVTGFLVIYGSKWINLVMFSRKWAKVGLAAATLLRKCLKLGCI